MRSIFRDYFNLRYKKLGVFKGFHMDIKFLEEKWVFLKLLLKLISKGFAIIYIDESCFTTHYDHNYIWHNNTFKCLNNIEQGNRFSNHQLILATTFDRIIHHKLFPGYNDAETFLAFFKETVTVAKEIYGGLGKVYFYLDNASVHDTFVLSNYAQEEKLKILYGVNNYSILDLCEYVFQPLKMEHYKMVYSKR
jgi:hypothetical protein